MLKILVLKIQQIVLKKSKNGVKFFFIILY